MSIIYVCMYKKFCDIYVLEFTDVWHKLVRVRDIKVKNLDLKWRKFVLLKGQSDFASRLHTACLFPRQNLARSGDTFLLHGSVRKLHRTVYIQNDIHHALITCLIRFPDSWGITANEHNFESSLVTIFVAVIVIQDLDNHNLWILHHNPIVRRKKFRDDSNIFF